MKSKAVQIALAFLFLSSVTWAQKCYWQQAVDYKIEVEMDVTSNTYRGKLRLQYKNNSPDSLKQVFFHLYPNAFQPGSMMDMRSRTITDPDRRVGDRILNLTPAEAGFLHVKNLKQDAKPVRAATELETILQVALAQTIAPGGVSVFEMEFDGQVPLQIRRSGRDNREGVRYSMSQWYPKICEYDLHGWHANPYIGREFHGVWGNFEVNLKLDSKYIVAATGVLQNAENVGYGYEKAGSKVKRPDGGLLEWKWKAENVHDFVWAADPDYVHIVRPMTDGPELHFFYQPGQPTKDWEQLPVYTERAFQVMNKRFGVYPFPKFSVIQGGDGGMEYPMATLITGHRSFDDLLGVTVHEMIHNWYQGVLATDESLYAWMDEGFTSYAESEVMAALLDVVPGSDPHEGCYQSYFGLVKAGLQEPMTTHADHYKTNRAYSTNAYSKGELTLAQLRYVVGTEAVERSLRRYFSEWKFKHPTWVDFKHCVELETGLELDWYFEYWVNTIETVDYEVNQAIEMDGKTFIELRRIGGMPMPIELTVEMADGNFSTHYVPLGLMYGSKPSNGTRVDHPAWPWTHPSYVIVVNTPLSKIKRIEIDPAKQMADVNTANNLLKVNGLIPGPGR